MNIEILKDFIPLDEYNKKIGSCSFFIFGHKRQQAMGNIISALWMGSSVFLYEDNPVYKFLKKSNFFVFEIKKFNQNYNELILTKEQKEINRELIKKIFNENEALKNIENIYNMLKN